MWISIGIFGLHHEFQFPFLGQMMVGMMFLVRWTFVGCFCRIQGLQSVRHLGWSFDVANKLVSSQLITNSQQIKEKKRYQSESAILSRILQPLQKTPLKHPMFFSVKPSLFPRVTLRVHVVLIPKARTASSGSGTSRTDSKPASSAAYSKARRW